MGIIGLNIDFIDLKEGMGDSHTLETVLESELYIGVTTVILDIKEKYYIWQIKKKYVSYVEKQDQKYTSS